MRESHRITSDGVRVLGDNKYSSTRAYAYIRGIRASWKLQSRRTGSQAGSAERSRIGVDRFCEPPRFSHRKIVIFQIMTLFLSPYYYLLLHISRESLVPHSSPVP